LLGVVSAVDCMESLVTEMTCFVSSAMLNSTQSFSLKTYVLKELYVGLHEDVVLSCL